MKFVTLRFALVCKHQTTIRCTKAQHQNLQASGSSAGTQHSPMIHSLARRAGIRENYAFGVSDRNRRLWFLLSLQVS